MKSFQKKLTRDITEYGRSVIGVIDDPAFSYTIGNALRQLPELLIFGVAPLDATWFLNHLSKMMIERKKAFDDGELVDLGGKFPTKIVTADDRAHKEFTIQAGRFHGGDDYVVQQVLVPDKSGRFPDEAVCDPPYCDLPLLKARRH